MMSEELDDVPSLTPKQMHVVSNPRTLSFS